MKQLDFYTSKVEELYSYIEGAIFEEVAKALRAQLKDPENGANVVEWQVRALQETGQLNDAVIKRLA
ncbi:phage minor capsid protein, partial [Salmonella enterica]|uniref:phage minor capsid protein n=1 Tax=Salmonella enterica TaxID=28901 RepID=UPI003CEB75A9